MIGLKIFAAAWPLLALAVGGTAAALWRIVTGDRSHAGDLVRWRDDQRAIAKAGKSAVKPGAGDAADSLPDTSRPPLPAPARRTRQSGKRRSRDSDRTGRDSTRHRSRSTERPSISRRHGPWLIQLDKAALELGPFEISPRQRIERRLIPVVPVLLGIAIDAVVVLVLGPTLAP